MKIRHDDGVDERADVVDAAGTGVQQGGEPDRARPL